MVGSSVIGLTTILLLGSCTSTVDHAQETPQASDETTPDFRGPWAAEFADLWSETTTDAERDALADGVVSEMEYAEVIDRMTRCMTDAGIEYTDRSSGYEYTFPPTMSADEANEITSECERASGEWTVGTLYTMVSHNPENIDDAVLMAACLIEKDVVPPGYTAADWEAEMENPTTLTGEGGPPEVWECNDDPLGLFDE